MPLLCAKSSLPLRLGGGSAISHPSRLESRNMAIFPRNMTYAQHAFSISHSSTVAVVSAK
jgi:hypothetical protein